MSPSPVTEQDKKGVELYRASWQALMQQVRSGSSWSGYERNCCFLNTGGQFVSASHVSGLDHADDGRGLAVTDWDQDGDLDLWFRNRTAPAAALPFLQSRCADLIFLLVPFASQTFQDEDLHIVPRRGRGRNRLLVLRD